MRLPTNSTTVLGTISSDRALVLVLLISVLSIVAVVIVYRRDTTRDSTRLHLVTLGLVGFSVTLLGLLVLALDLPAWVGWLGVASAFAFAGHALYRREYRQGVSLLAGMTLVTLLLFGSGHNVWLLKLCLLLPFALLLGFVIASRRQVG